MSATESLLLLVSADPWARDRVGHNGAVSGHPDTEIAVRVNYAEFLAATGEEQERAAMATLLLLWASAARGTTFCSAHPASPYAVAWAVYWPLHLRASSEASTHAAATQGAARAALHEAQWAAVRGTPVARAEYDALVAADRAAESAYADYLAGDQGTAPARRAAQREVNRWAADLTGGPGEFNRLFALTGARRAMPLDAAAW